MIHFVAEEKETNRKKKKKKEKKKKKDRSKSRSPDGETVKSSSPNNHTLERSNRDTSPVVRVKSEFPEGIGKLGSGNRKHDKKHSGGQRNNVRAKEEFDRREINSSDKYSYQHGRSPSPRRRGTDVGVNRDSRFLMEDGTRSADYIKKNVCLAAHGKDRSSTAKTEGRSHNGRCDSNPSTKNRIIESSGQFDRRDDHGKKRRRSTSPGEVDDRRKTSEGFVDRNRKHQSRSPDHRDGRQKIRRRSSSSSDDDRDRTQSDRCSRVENERHRQRSRSPSYDRRQDRSDRDHIDSDARKHRHHCGR